MYNIQVKCYIKVFQIYTLPSTIPYFLQERTTHSNNYKTRIQIPCKEIKHHLFAKSTLLIDVSKYAVLLSLDKKLTNVRLFTFAMCKQVLI